jgi:F-type H+-transporting ATPase subunit b
MSVLVSSSHFVARILPMAEVDVDDSGYITKHWFFPDRAEWLYGGLAFLIVAFLLYRFALPGLQDGMNKRSERIGADIEAASAAKTAAEADAMQIRTALGDIEAERARLLAEADAQAEAVLADGRVRLASELAEIEARAQAEVATMGSRAGDELRAEITRLSSAAVDHVVNGVLDDSVQQDLIEDFIARVGASA